MPSKRTHDVVATIGTYKDATGAEKKRYINVGSAFTSEDGNLSIKLDAVPVSPEWSGWLSLYVPKERDGAPRAAPAPRPAPASQTATLPGVTTMIEEDDIPF